MVNSGRPIRCTLIWMRQIIKISQLVDSELKLWHLNVKKRKETSKATYQMWMRGISNFSQTIKAMDWGKNLQTHTCHCSTMRHLVIKPPPGFPSESCTRAVQDFQSLSSQKVGPTQVKAGTKNLALKPCRTPLEDQVPPYHRPHLCRCLKTVFMSRCNTR